MLTRAFAVLAAMAAAIASADAGRQPESRDLAARLLGQLVPGIRPEGGLSEGRQPRRGVLLHRRRRTDPAGHHRRQRRRRHVERPARHHRGLCQRRADPRHLGADDRRARAVLVRQSRQQDPQPQGRRRQDHRVLGAGLVLEPDPAHAAQAGRLEGKAGRHRRPARNAHAGDDRPDRHRLGGAAVCAARAAGEQDRHHRARARGDRAQGPDHPGQHRQCRGAQDQARRHHAADAGL